MEFNPIKSATWVVAVLIALAILRPLFLGWYGDSVLTDLLVGAAACALGSVAVVVVAWLRPRLWVRSGPSRGNGSSKERRMPTKHRTAAIVVAIVVLAVSFLPVLITVSSGYDLGNPRVVHVFLYPTIGVAVAAIIVVLSFMRS